MDKKQCVMGGATTGGACGKWLPLSAFRSYLWKDGTRGYEQRCKSCSNHARYIRAHSTEIEHAKCVEEQKEFERHARWQPGPPIITGLFGG